MKKEKNILQDKRAASKKNNSGKIGVMIVGSVVALFIIVCLVLSYAADYSKATQTAKNAMYGEGNLLVEEKDEYFYFSNEEEKESATGIIFYPGGKVEEDAYAPLLSELAEQNYEVYLVCMPWHLAVLNKDGAQEIIHANPEIENWIMMGHSLGGAMAASYTAEHTDEIDGLVLLAAYSTEDLSQTDIPVLSIYGTEDGVLNKEKYEECFSNLPEDAVEYVIEGGNHANFGYYGEQKGDGIADISRDEQIQQVMDLLITWGKD